MKPGTPLPWTVDPADDLPPAVIEDTEDGYGVAECGHPDDAAYIAHACNLYPKLVEACRVALEALYNVPCVGEEYDEQHSAIHMRASLILTQAITKAEKCKP